MPGPPLLHSSTRKWFKAGQRVQSRHPLFVLTGDATIHRVFGEFLRVLCQQWLAIVTGALASGGLLLWSVSTDADPPRWAYLGLFGLAFVGAAYGAWATERTSANSAAQSLRDLLDAKPAAALAFDTGSLHIVLTVTNTGAQGSFRALVDAEAGKMKLTAPALWEHTMTADAITLGHLSSARLKLAMFVEDRRTVYIADWDDTIEPHVKWELKYEKQDHGQFWYPKSVAIANEDPAMDWMTIKVRIFSEPELADRVAARTIRLVGRHGIDAEDGSRLTPGVLVREDQDEYGQDR